MRVFTEMADVRTAAAAQEELGVSEWLLVDQDRVGGFADLTGDHQWIHVDVERAQRSSYGGTIAHGYLALALVAGLSTQVYRFDVTPIRLNYGSNRVRFPAPLLVGARVRDRVHLAAVSQTPAGHLVTLRHTLEVEGQSRPALSAETLTLLVGGDGSDGPTAAP